VRTVGDIVMLEHLAQTQARRSFYAYRQYINPTLLWGWFHKYLARALQAFYVDLVAGKRPILILTVPPQHGKSTAVVDFVSWVAGKNPSLRVIYGSYGDDLGVRANLTLQRTFDSEIYKGIFGDILSGRSAASSGVRNQERLDYVGHTGSFANTSVRGQITGKAVDLGIIDDPHKNREEANSKSIRDKVWSWYTDDVKPRASENSGFVVIMTRWHLDDLVGRIMESPDADRVRLVSFAAIAERDEEHRKAGEALFPELKSVEFLLEQKAAMIESSWSALYQQTPIPQGGGMFPVERFDIVPIPPASGLISLSVRYWDKAGTKDGTGAQTAGVLMHKLSDGRYYVSDVVTGRWSALEREQRIKLTAELDGPLVPIWVEQEPGSGGKESAEATIRNLAGWNVFADRVHGDKTSRAEPYAAQVQGSNVVVLQKSWTRDFIEQHEHFPAGKLKDIVDAAGGAFSKLTAKTKTAGAW
jgi:predicted phage terminase large subunit-like protein